MNTSRIGAVAEREVRADLEACGYIVIKSAASKGPADLIAFREDEALFIQVKRGSWASPAERRGLMELALMLPGTGTALVVNRQRGNTVPVWRFLYGVESRDYREWVLRHPDGTPYYSDQREPAESDSPALSDTEGSSV